MTSDTAVVATYDTALDAHLMRGFLESRGVPSSVIDENMVTWDPLMNVALGGIKVVVRTSDFDAARSLVKEFEHPSAGTEREIERASDAEAAQSEEAPIEPLVEEEKEFESSSTTDPGSDTLPTRAEVTARWRSKTALLSILLPFMAPIFLFVAFSPLEGAESSMVARRHLRNAKVFSTLGTLLLLLFVWHLTSR